MDEMLSKFQGIVRRSHNFTEARTETSGGLHPFDERNIHPDVERVSKKLFDDGHYSQATFEAFKYLDKKIQSIAKSSESGYKLMMQAFSETSPLIKLTALLTISEKDEQQGYKFIFSGAVLAIRNPRGHEYGLKENPDKCLDHLSLASLLLRRLDEVRS